MNRLCVLAVCGLVVTSVSASDNARAASIPYIENFDDEPDTAYPIAPPSEPAPESGEFYETISGGLNSGFWTVESDPNGSGKVYLGGFGTSGVVNSSAAIPFSNIVGNDFYMTTEIVVVAAGNSPNGNGGMHVGFGAFGDRPHFNSGRRYELVYVADAGTPPSTPLGSLRLLEVGGDGQVSAISSQTVPVAIGPTYTLALHGFYTSSGALNLSGMISRDGFPIATVFDTDTTPLNGANFGYTINSVVAGSGAAFQFDNFSIIAEPSATMLLAVGAISLLGYRKAKS